MKKAVVVLALLLSMAMLVAGGSKESGPVTLEFWYENAGPARTPYIEELISRFEAENPDIKVHLVALANSEAKQKYDVAVASKETPDVAGFQCQWLSGYIMNGALCPLDDYLASWDEYEDQSPTIINGIRAIASDNKLYMMPNSYNYGPMYWARADWYAEKGLKAPETWDEFFSNIEATTDPANGTYGYSIRGGAGGPDELTYLMYAYSGIDYPFTEDGKSTINDPKHVEIIQRIVDLYGVCTPQSDITNAYKELVAAFDSGTVGCIQHNLGSYGEHSQALEQDQFFAFVAPLADNGKRVASFASNAVGFGMFNNSKHKEEAFRFISFMCSAESQSYFNQISGQLPISQTAANEDWVQERQHLTVVVDAVNGETTVSFPFPYYLPDYAAINSSVAQPAFQAVLAGQMTVEDFLDQWADALTAAYAEYNEYVVGK